MARHCIYIVRIIRSKTNYPSFPEYLTAIICALPAGLAVADEFRRAVGIRTATIIRLNRVRRRSEPDGFPGGRRRRTRPRGRGRVVCALVLDNFVRNGGGRANRNRPLFGSAWINYCYDFDSAESEEPLVRVAVVGPVVRFAAFGGANGASVLKFRSSRRRRRRHRKPNALVR